MSKITIELTGDDFARLLQSSLNNNLAVGQEAKRLLLAGLAKVKVQPVKAERTRRFKPSSESKVSRKKLRKRMRET